MFESSAPTAPHGRGYRRILLGTLLILLVFAFVSVYGSNITRIVILWFTMPHSYSQGALIFGISIYMVLHHVSELRRLSLQPWIAAGTLLTAAAGLVFLAGNLTETLVLEQISLIVTLLGLVLLIAGPNYFKILFIPIVYLIFLFPLFGTLLGGRILLLQNLSAAIGTGLLKLFGFTVFRQGHLIQLPHISLDVVEACSGLNHIVSLVAIAIPLAHFARLPRWWKLALVFLAVAVGIFANGLRITLIGIWTHFFPEADVHGPSDVLLVSFVFLFGLAALVSLLALFTRITRQFPIVPQKPLTDTILALPRHRVGNAVFAALVILVGVKAGSFYFDTPPVPYPQDILPTAVGEWRGQTMRLDTEPYNHIAADNKFKRLYHHPDGRQVSVFLAYFAKQTPHRELFSPSINQLTAGARIETTTLKDGSLQPVIAFQIKEGAKAKPTLAVYQVHDGFYADRLDAKWALLKTTLFRRQNNAALIVFLAPRGPCGNNPPPHEQLAQELLPIIRAGDDAS